MIFDPTPPRGTHFAELYDLKKDPGQSHNLLQDIKYRESRMALRAIMKKIMAETPPQKIPPFVMEHCEKRPWFERIRWPFSPPEDE